MPEDLAPDPELYAESLLAGTIPREAWTHGAHVVACVGLVRAFGAREALHACRSAIPRLNAGHGVVNDDTSGYHETITVFFVAAIADSLARGVGAAELVTRLGRDAPLAHWTAERLMSVEARRGWVEPDLAVLPFPLPG